MNTTNGSTAPKNSNATWESTDFSDLGAAALPAEPSVAGTPQEPATVILFGLRLAPLTMDQTVERCDAALRTQQRLLIGVVNAAKIVALRKDAMLRESLLNCDLLLADGQSVVWAGRLLRRRLPERVTGIDLFERLLIRAEQTGESVFLLGATDRVLALLRENLSTRFPKLKIAGMRNGYFTPEEAEAVAAQIRGSGAEMLFLGMSSPKKENFLADFGADLGVPIQHGVGGSFDIFAGLTKRAPLSWQKVGMEWAYRLLQEPGRMWRRYLVTNLAFVLITCRELIRRTPAHPKPLQRKIIDLRGPEPTVHWVPARADATAADAAHLRSRWRRG